MPEHPLEYFISTGPSALPMTRDSAYVLITANADIETIASRFSLALAQ